MVVVSGRQETGGQGDRMRGKRGEGSKDGGREGLRT